jgi:hypothetical protein
VTGKLRNGFGLKSIPPASPPARKMHNQLLLRALSGGHSGSRRILFPFRGEVEPRVESGARGGSDDAGPFADGAIFQSRGRTPLYRHSDI